MYQKGDNIGQIEAYGNVLSVVIITGLGFFVFQEKYKYQNPENRFLVLK